MYLLRNTLRPYAWGSTTAMAELFGREPSGEPEAELWIGAHSGAPSVLVPPVAGSDTLDELIATDPERMLGADAVARFGPELPFLAKILAAGAPLSLQVHPTPEQARAGYAAEEEAGIDRGARDRNYKDEHHKPEMIFALTPFEALCGFRSPDEAAGLFRALTAAVSASGRDVPELLEWIVAELSSGHPAPERLQSVFRALINDGEAVRAAVELSAAAAESARGTYGREMATLAELNGYYPGDPGVLLSLLLNRVSLQPGDAVYLPAGNVHAYLSGLGVEVMAASDNVLRGGLTPKHVDVPELLKTVDFRPLGVPYLSADTTGPGQQVFRPPFEEFALQRLELAQGPAGSAGDSLPTELPVLQNGPAVVIAVRGTIVLASPTGSLTLEAGQSAFVPAAEAPVTARLAADSAQHDDGALAFAVTVGTAPDREPDAPRLDLGA
ncbi:MULTISPECIES: mannose-6-phosphate isomerase, class I [unclassified Arthrobacter]|uniref:mannose-6-phosphate isomerase, class I n=1 Tax=unclassified Arthrobacter TaxID=235627 RepID=UPI0024E0374D|nr:MULTISPECIES: mannose-6-phosphate isomerase, class I [unclassified Arthrobacter]MCC9146105.1 mannose-6-phosphate isomerase, class I [Arthrobacter sp. zg-Y919]MDK1277334.1 mannose-6-phosphate isomerase, class I [Arthrobacter sp. zg.Y919]WIB03835.1 mannose-6-phosphate isomerase, class I [Arthrobacter sp. zg-Y919]